MNKSLRRASGIALLLVPMFLAPVVLAFDTPLDRWAKALGGRDRIAAIKSIYREGTIEYAGMQVSLKVWHTADGKYRKEEKAENYSLIETFDGAIGGVQQGTEAPRKMTDAEMKVATSRRFANANAMFFAFFPERRNGTVSIEDENTIVLKPAGGIEWRVILDPETSLPKKMLHQEGERTVTVEFGSYETVDGIKFEKEMQRSAGGPQKAVIHFTKTVINAPIESSLFSIAN
jgi:hypothetical protein